MLTRKSLTLVSLLTMLCIFTATPCLAQAEPSALVVHFDASDLNLADGQVVSTWGSQTAAGTPMLRMNQTPNGGQAVEFSGNGDRFGDNVVVASSAAQDWIVAAVVRPNNTGAYHNLVDDDAEDRPMLWIDPAYRYELNFSGGTGARAVGTGIGGWDVVIADSRNNQLYVNSPTPNASGRAPIAYPIPEDFDFFHRDGGQTFSGLVAELRVYNDAAAFASDFASLYSELYDKWIATEPVGVPHNAATEFIAGPTPQSSANTWQYVYGNDDLSQFTLLSDWDVGGNEINGNVGQWDDNRGRDHPHYPHVMKTPAGGVGVHPGNVLIIHPGDHRTDTDTPVAVAWLNNTGGTVSLSYNVTWRLDRGSLGIDYFVQRGLFGSARYLTLESGSLLGGNGVAFSAAQSSIELLPGELLYVGADHAGAFYWDFTQLDLVLWIVPSTVAVSGTVSSDCEGPLANVAVDLDHPNGDMFTTSTNASGDYLFEDVPRTTEEAVVASVVPLGYVADVPSPAQAMAPLDQNQVINFTLTCLDPDGEARSMGYWKHQANVFLKNKGNAQETQEDMETNYPAEIFDHFHENGLNAIEVEGVTYVNNGGPVMLDLATIHATLSVKGNAGMVAKAKQQYLSLLLNIASGKLLTSSVVSEDVPDGATASQALQLVVDYINDSDPSNDEIAKDICDTINNAQLVPAGVIDLGIQTIAYSRPYQLGRLATVLHGAAPNPFLSSTTIRFQLKEPGEAKVVVFDINGRLVKSVFDQWAEAGPHEVDWSGVSDQGTRVASGIYYIRMVAKDYEATKRAVFIR